MSTDVNADRNGAAANSDTGVPPAPPRLDPPAESAPGPGTAVDTTAPATGDGARVHGPVRGGLVGPVLQGELVEDDPRDETTPATTADDGDGDGEGRVLVDPPDVGPGSWMERARSAPRRPVLPEWAADRTTAAAAARWLAGYVGHVAAYHALRAPKYAALLTARAPLGAARVVGTGVRWVGDLEGWPLRQAAARRNDVEAYLRLSRQRDLRVRVRVLIAVPVLIAAGVGVVLGWSVAPGWVQWAGLAALITGFGLLGAPGDRRRVLDTAVVPTPAAKLTSEIVTRALESLGIAQINARGGRVTFPSPIVRDGPGWRAEVDLPFGVTATDVLDRRDKLASGLRRPLGCVWPEPVHDQHAGRLVIWVGDQDLSQARPATWPLARHGQADLFKPVPYGTDQRGRPVTIPLMFANVLIGAMPRFGKTFAMRVLMLSAALDPTAELRVFELKGTGDLSAIEGCCHHYASGPDDETIAACVASLEEVDAELERRAKVIRGLPATVCPENKVTPQLASRRDLRLHPLVVGIDECQELFTHPEHGERAGELAVRIIKRGPALGIILVLATQRPDAKSLPTGVSANVGVRLCLRVMGQLENDMVLGTSAYKNGIRATTFGPRDKGIGYLVGAADDPQITRSYYIDAPTAGRIGLRARGLREAAGRLTGHAAGIDTLDATRGDDGRTLLTDLLAVFPATEDKAWSENLVARLAAHRPDQYQGWRPEQLAAALRPYGLRTEQVWSAPDTGGKQANRRGLLRAAVVEALEHHTTRSITHRDSTERGD